MQEVKNRRQEVVAELQELQNSVDEILQLMQDETVMKKMELMRDYKSLISYLQDKFNVSIFSVFYPS